MGHAAQAQTTADSYTDVFVPLGKVTPLMSAANVARGALRQTVEQNVGIVSQVPAGLAHHQPLVTAMQANGDDDGALLVLASGLGPVGPRPARVSVHHGAGPTPA